MSRMIDLDPTAFRFVHDAANTRSHFVCGKVAYGDADADDDDMPSILLPFARTPFGTATRRGFERRNKKEVEFQYSLDDIEHADWLQRFDAHFLQWVKDNRLSLWPRDVIDGESTLTNEDIDRRFHPSCQSNKNNKYTPTLSIKMTQPGTVVSLSRVPDTDEFLREEVTVDKIPERCQVKALVRPVMYWVTAKEKFGVKWIASKAVALMQRPAQYRKQEHQYTPDFDLDGNAYAQPSKKRARDELSSEEEEMEEEE